MRTFVLRLRDVEVRSTKTSNGRRLVLVSDWFYRVLGSSTLGLSITNMVFVFPSQVFVSLGSPRRTSLLFLRTTLHCLLRYRKGSEPEGLFPIRTVVVLRTTHYFTSRPTLYYGGSPSDPSCELAKVEQKDIRRESVIDPSSRRTKKRDRNREWMRTSRCNGERIQLCTISCRL